MQMKREFLTDASGIEVKYKGDGNASYCNAY